MDAARGPRGLLPPWFPPSLALFALLVRLAVAAHPHSGEGAPPRFGDFEAQRHWMEITTQTPLGEWYRETPRNDLQYWGLDYPPLTAYQSWAYGVVLGAIEPELVALGASRGHETATGKRLMRWSVLVSDALVFFPGVAAFALVYHRRVKDDERAARGEKPPPPGRASSSGATPHRKPPPRRNLEALLEGFRDPEVLWAWALAALNPAHVLVDHGHFQYNAISLGLVAAAAAAVLANRDLVGSVLFVLAMNHKQMSLYYAPAFFAHLLGKALRRPRRSSRAKKVAALGAIVLLAFAILWAPFWFAPEPPGVSSNGRESRGERAGARGVLAVLGRLAPFRRGIYEDYVANFWCVTNPAFRWRHILPVAVAARLCAATTLVALAPSAWREITRPTPRGFAWCLATCAWAFFAFGFQTHEKSALLPLLPITLLATEASALATLAPPVVSLSMWPLLKRDRLGTAYVGMVAMFVAMFAGGPPRKARGNGTGEGASDAKGGEASEGGGRRPRANTSRRDEGDAAAGAARGKRTTVARERPPSKVGEGTDLSGDSRKRFVVPGVFTWSLANAVALGAFALAHSAEIFVAAPEALPHVHDLLFVSSSFVLFVGFAAYGARRQFECAREEPKERKTE